MRGAAVGRVVSTTINTPVAAPVLLIDAATPALDTVKNTLTVAGHGTGHRQTHTPHK